MLINGWATTSTGSVQSLPQMISDEAEHEEDLQSLQEDIELMLSHGR